MEREIWGTHRESPCGRTARERHWNGWGTALHCKIQVLSTKPEGKRPAGRPSCGGDDAEAGINICRRKSQDRKEWTVNLSEVKAKLGRAIAQAVSRWRPGFDPRSGKVGLVVDKVALG
jgi:hypothetical protein